MRGPSAQCVSAEPASERVAPIGSALALVCPTGRPISGLRCTSPAIVFLCLGRSWSRPPLQIVSSARLSGFPRSPALLARSLARLAQSKPAAESKTYLHNNNSRNHIDARFMSSIYNTTSAIKWRTGNTTTPPAAGARPPRFRRAPERPFSLHFVAVAPAEGQTT